MYFSTVVSLVMLCEATGIYQWGAWSVCSKTCDIGKQIRSRIIDEEGRMTTQKQYCNTQYCSEKAKCKDSHDCWPHITDGMASCINQVCVCTMGPGYNKDNCFIEYGNCVIRKDPPTALGFKDPSLNYRDYGYKLHSCTTADNPRYEVHVIGIYGDRSRYVYEIFVRPRGPVTKPVILVLTSYESTQWKIDTTIGLHVIYSGYNVDSSSVQNSYSSQCGVSITKRPDLSYGYGSDTGGGHTLQLLKQLNYEFGPVTSVTGYYELSTYPVSRIMLNIGGNPLAVVSRSYTYNSTYVNCTLPNITINKPQQTSTLPPYIFTTRRRQFHTTTKRMFPTTTTESLISEESNPPATIVAAVVGGCIITLVVVGLVLCFVRFYMRTRQRTERRSISERISTINQNNELTSQIIRSLNTTQNHDLMYPRWTGNERAPAYESIHMDDNPPAYEDLFKNTPTNVHVYDQLGKPDQTDSTHGYPT